MMTKKLRERERDAQNQVLKEDLEKVMVEKIKLVFKDLQAMQPVRIEEIPSILKAHNTHLFKGEKFTAGGKHDKFKSWLVAHGNEQDSTIYTYRSSPTVVIQSLMTCLTLAACNNGCKMGKQDVKGAFIQTEMSKIPVYVQCRGKLKDLILRVLPELKKYVDDDGVLYCKLHKALYSCVQASKLWYEKLQSETDP
jgi:hypothetical protein